MDITEYGDFKEAFFALVHWKVIGLLRLILTIFHSRRCRVFQHRKRLSLLFVGFEGVRNIRVKKENSSAG